MSSDHETKLPDTKRRAAPDLTPPEKKHSVNKFIDFYPKASTARDVARQGDGPPVPSQAAETMKPNSRPGDPLPKDAKSDAKPKLVSKDTKKDAKPKKKKALMKEEDVKDDALANAWAVYRYLHRRRENWLYRIDEGTNLRTFVEKITDFADYAAAYLDLKTIPAIEFQPTQTGTTFASWSPEGINLAISNRHPMDVFRSFAHELVHHKQHEDDELHAESGVTGSDHENEANALAGIMMRNYAKANPELFDLEYIEEGFIRALFGLKNKVSASRGKAAKASAKASTQSGGSRQRKGPPANDDDDYTLSDRMSNSTYRHFHSPERTAKVEKAAKWHAKYDDNRSPEEKHNAMMAQRAKHPLPTSGPGEVHGSFSNILAGHSKSKSKNTGASGPPPIAHTAHPRTAQHGNFLSHFRGENWKVKPKNEENISRVLAVLDAKKNWNQAYDVIDEANLKDAFKSLKDDTVTSAKNTAKSVVQSVKKKGPVLYQKGLKSLDKVGQKIGRKTLKLAGKYLEEDDVVDEANLKDAFVDLGRGIKKSAQETFGTHTTKFKYNQDTKKFEKKKNK